CSPMHGFTARTQKDCVFRIGIHAGAVGIAPFDGRKETSVQGVDFIPECHFPLHSKYPAADRSMAGGGREARCARRDSVSRSAHRRNQMAEDNAEGSDTWQSRQETWLYSSPTASKTNSHRSLSLWPTVAS